MTKTIREYNWINGFFLALAILSIVNYYIYFSKNIISAIISNIISFIISLALAFQKHEVEVK